MEISRQLQGPNAVHSRNVRQVTTLQGNGFGHSSKITTSTGNGTPVKQLAGRHFTESSRLTFDTNDTAY